MELSDEKLEMLYNKYTVELREQTQIRGISQPLFVHLMEYAYSVGYHSGVEKGINESLEAIEKGFQLSGL